jgi:hypothetical protein
MNKLHITIVAALLAAAAALGTFAATRTVSLGAAHTRASTDTVLSRTKQLGRFEASLRQALAKKPPALPTVPKAPAARQAGAPAAQPRVIYQRPPAIVVVRHTHHGDDGGSREAAGDGGGGGGD